MTERPKVKLHHLLDLFIPFTHRAVPPLKRRACCHADLHRTVYNDSTGSQDTSSDLHVEDLLHVGGAGHNTDTRLPAILSNHSLLLILLEPVESSTSHPFIIFTHPFPPPGSVGGTPFLSKWREWHVVARFSL